LQVPEQTVHVTVSGLYLVYTFCMWGLNKNLYDIYYHIGIFVKI